MILLLQSSEVAMLIIRREYPTFFRSGNAKSEFDVNRPLSRDDMARLDTVVLTEQQISRILDRVLEDYQEES